MLAEGFRVIGYYTLSAYTINPIELPREIARKLPRTLAALRLSSVEVVEMVAEFTALG